MVDQAKRRRGGALDPSERVRGKTRALSARMGLASAMLVWALVGVACGDDGGATTGGEAPCGGSCPAGQACVADACVPIGTGNGGTSTNNGGTSTNNSTSSTNNSTSTSTNNASTGTTNNSTTAPCTQDFECLDAATYCDVASGQCLPGCRDDVNCATNEFCNEDRDCETIEGFCDSTDAPDRCEDDAFCCGLESFCDVDAERCIDGCRVDAHCPLGLPCLGATPDTPGVCGCSEDADCDDNFVCNGGLCVPGDCTPDAYEPNNDVLAATELDPVFGDGATLEQARVCGEELDVYAIWLLEGTTLSGGLVLEPGEPELRWEWNDPAGDRVVRGDNDEPFEFAAEQTGVHTLTVEINRVSEGDQRGYALDYALSGDGVDCDPDGPPSVTLRLGLEAEAQVDTQAICPDVTEVFPVELERPGQGLTVGLRRRDALPNTEAILEVWDGDELVADASGVGLRLDVEIDAIGVDPEIRVRIGDGATPVGMRYGLEVTSSPPDVTDNCVEDDFEPNNSADAALELQPGLNEGLVVCSDDGVDWFFVDVSPGDAAEIQVISQTTTAPDVELILPDGRTLVGVPSQCAGERPCALLPSVTTTAPGRWELSVSTGQGANIPYDVSIDVSQACDPAPGRWVDGCACVPDPRDAPFASEPGSTPFALPVTVDDAPGALVPDLSGTLCADDLEDTFPLWTPPNTGLRVAAMSTGGGGLNVELRDADGLVVASGAADEVLEAAPGPGFRRWIVSIRGASSAAAGYNLQAALVVEGGASCQDDAFEALERNPDADLGPAYGTWSLAEPGVLCGSDSDRFPLTNLQDGDRITLRARRLWASGNRLVLTLSDRDGVVASAEERDGVAELELTIDTTRQFAVDVSAQLGAPSFGLGYRLEATLERPGGACVNEVDEPNDAPGDAGELTSGWNYGGVLCRQVDGVDFYRIEARAGERLSLRYQGAGGADVVLLPPGGGDPIAGISAEQCGPGLECLEFGPVDVGAGEAGDFVLEVRTGLLFPDIPYRIELNKAPLCEPPVWEDGCVCVEDAFGGTPDEPGALTLSEAPVTEEALTLCGPSEDWFRFEGDARNKRLRIGFDQTTAGLIRVDLFGGVLGTEPIADAIAGDDLTFDNPQFRDLWMRVAHGGDGVGYSFTYSVEDIPVCLPDSYEPNNAPDLGADRTTLVSEDIIELEDGVLCGPGDGDWFLVDFLGDDDSLVATVDRITVAEAGDPEYVEDGIDTQGLVVTIYDDNLQVIAQAEGAGELLAATANNLLFGDFWVEVSMTQPVVGSTEPRYTLILENQPASAASCQELNDDIYENNDSAETAAAIEFEDEQDRVTLAGLVACGNADDPDWYSVALEAGQENVVVEIESTFLDGLELMLFAPDQETRFEAEVRSPCNLYARCLQAEIPLVDTTGDWFIAVTRLEPFASPLVLDYEATVFIPADNP